MYLGIDIHKRYSQVAVVDSDGNLQQESRLPNDRLADLAEEYAGSDSHGRNFRKRSEPRNVSIQSEAKLIRSA